MKATTLHRSCRSAPPTQNGVCVSCPLLLLSGRVLKMRTGQGRPLPLHTVKASSELMRRGTKQRVSKRESNSCGYVALIISLIAVFTLASLLFLESYFRGATTNPLVIFTKPKVNSDLNSGEHIDVMTWNHLISMKRMQLLIAPP